MLLGTILIIYKRFLGPESLAFNNISLKFTTFLIVCVFEILQLLRPNTKIDKRKKMCSVL